MMIILMKIRKESLRFEYSLLCLLLRVRLLQLVLILRFIHFVYFVLESD